MPDNVPVTPGVGASIATDDVGGVHYQIVKHAFGPLDSAIIVEDAATKRFPVHVGTLPAESTASGNLTGAAQTVTMALDNGMSAVGVQITGTWTGQLEFEASVDGTNYESHSMVRSLLDTVANATVSNGIFFAGTSGFSSFRVRSSALSSGTAVVSIRSSHTPQSVHMESAIPPGSNEIGAVVSRKDLQRISVQSSGLTTSVTAYSIADQVGNIFEAANAARVSGGSGVITGIVLISAADIIGTYDIVLFDQSVTLAADNATFAISDADALNIVAVVPLTSVTDIGNNRVAQAFNLAVPYKCNATSLFAGLITRVGHTFFGATTDLQLVIYVERN